MISQPRKIIDRLCSSLGVSKLKELANFLNVVPSAINGAIRKRQIPDGWLYKVAYQTGRRIEWLRTGEGPEFTDTIAETKHRYGLEEEAVRIYLTRRLELEENRRELIDRIMDRLMNADDRTRKALLDLLQSTSESSRPQRDSAPKKKTADSA